MQIQVTEQEFSSIESIYKRLLAQREKVTRVFAGEDLQSAIDKATPGETILLEKGVNYPGNIYLPFRNHEPKVRITSSLEFIDRQINPNFDSRAILVTPNPTSIIQTAPGTSGWEFSDIEFVPFHGMTAMIALGSLSSEQTQVDSVPKRITLNRIIARALDKQVRRAVLLASDDTIISNSFIDGVGQDGRDSQAICGANCVGRHIIANNFLEASTEVIMYGGADSRSPELIPTNLKIFKNTITRRLSWRTGTKLAFKNLLEFKVGRKADIYENGFSNHWGDFFCWLKSVDQPDELIAPWSIVEEINIFKNVITDVASGFNLNRNPHGTALPMNRINIYNNTMDISRAKYGHHGWAFAINGVDDTSIIGNKILNDGDATIFLAGGDIAPAYRLKIQNNEFVDNAYGIKGDGSGEGIPSLDKHARDWVVTGNKIRTASPHLYPQENEFLPVN